MPVTRPILRSASALVTCIRKGCADAITGAELTRVSAAAPKRRFSRIGTVLVALMFWAGCSDEAAVSPLYSSLTDSRPDAQAIDPEIEEPGSGGAPGKDLPGDVDDLGWSTDPSNPPDPELAEVEDRYVPDIDHGPTPTAPAGSTERMISNILGGRIDHGKVRLDVPAGALDVTTSTIFKVEIPSGNALRVNLYPHGVQFRKPVTLTIDLSDATNVGEHVALYWWDEDGKVWKNVGGTYDPVTKILVTKLDHFSSYAPGRAGWNTDPGKPKLVEKG